MKVVVSRAAGLDVGRLADFLKHDDEALASRAVMLIEQAFVGLRSFSERGAMVNRRGDRRLTIPFGRAAYLLDYRVEPSRGIIIILRVRHSRENR